LPQGARVTLNARIITSGHGGAFPPGLPVGIVSSVGDSGIKVQLFVDFSRLEYVRIADFGLDGLEDLLDLSIQKRSGLSKVGRQSAKK
jgi:rod shape-determining protein MreC